jgi:hypothetical protein
MRSVKNRVEAYIAKKCAIVDGVGRQSTMQVKRAIRQIIRRLEKADPHDDRLWSLRADLSAFPTGRNPPSIQELVGSALH